ncbi:DUF4132 domain-containing protein [Actinomadura sp. NAK00032]|uniref:DUF4132 domain-containing protein n=1 Tax=Actinomadura sp. NAK00032 TaxID=2742128 RepID=UPI00158FBFA9|nr:DUF4132 domain-containing protein [Actinomadura sp. NAK00032]QKW38305.1 DUF4132 domain-containing protein [Actinomadura sp. NAK00032]
MEDQLQAGEDELVIPEGWRRQLYARRGGRPGPKIKAVPSGGAELRERAMQLEPAHWEAVEPASAKAARDYLDGDANALGAAVLGKMLADAPPHHGAVGELAVPLTDAWAADHGAPFAACAFVELATLFDHSGIGTIGGRIRNMLARAGDAEYADAVERLAAYRDTPTRRVSVSFLVPTREDWVDECCAAPPDPVTESKSWWLLYSALGSRRQVEMIAHHGPVLSYWWDRPFLVTMMDGAGAAIAPLLAEAFDENQGFSAQRTKPFVEALSMLPGDEALQALLDRADNKLVKPLLVAATKRFPERARRLLPSEALPGGAGRREDGLPDAPPAALPRPLADPPWQRAGERPHPAPVEGLTPPAATRMRWLPGERDAWSKTDHRHREPSTDDWDALVDEFRRGRAGGYGLGVLTYGPEEEVRPLLGAWKPQLWEAEMWLRPTVARFEADALPVALRIAEADMKGLGDRALPFLDAELARLMAERLNRPKKGRDVALAWFDRHGLDAVPLLVPAAVGKPGKPQREAEDALRLLADAHGTDKVVDEAARAHGDQAAAALHATLAIDPLDLLPDRIPPVPDWADVQDLPQIKLRSRNDALPADATQHLLPMLAISSPMQVYAGVGIVKEACDRASIASFSWELFQLWRQHGAPAKDGWALAQLGWLGDDETARRLAPLIRAWPGEGGHAKAVTGLDVLTAIGGEVALMHLYGIAQKVKFKGLKARAQEKVQQVADNLGLTSDELGDRLVPDFGLDATGGLVLDYGPRRFLVAFDEHLKPFVTDEDGTHRKSLPKPGAKDDKELAPAAHQRFAALKKDVRTVAADQIRRLESAMIAQRRWTAPEFRRFFAEHPLVSHIARRLIWLAEDATTFRIAEDGTLANADDEALKLQDNATIRIPHPLEFHDTLTAWTTLFADYEILQPFPQLGRTVHTLTAAERAARQLDRLQGLTVPAMAVLGLERRGWRRGGAMDAGLQWSIYRETPGGLYVNVKLDPGMAIGDLEDRGPQQLQVIRLDDHPEDGYWNGTRIGRPFGDLDPITTSELITELTEAAS